MVPAGSWGSLPACCSVPHTQCPQGEGRAPPPAQGSSGTDGRDLHGDLLTADPLGWWPAGKANASLSLDVLLSAEEGIRMRESSGKCPVPFLRENNGRFGGTATFFWRVQQRPRHCKLQSSRDVDEGTNSGCATQPWWGSRSLNGMEQFFAQHSKFPVSTLSHYSRHITRRKTRKLLVRIKLNEKAARERSVWPHNSLSSSLSDAPGCWPSRCVSQRPGDQFWSRCPVLQPSCKSPRPACLGASSTWKATLSSSPPLPHLATPFRADPRVAPSPSPFLPDRDVSCQGREVRGGVCALTLLPVPAC